MIKCLTCNEMIEPDPSRVSGCGCDPDAPSWVYVEPDGTVKGFSQARWIVIDANRAFQDWLEEGIVRGFCSDVWCWSHDHPTIENETTKAYIEAQGSEDPCIDCVSIYHIFDSGDSPSIEERVDAMFADEDND